MKKIEIIREMLPKFISENLGGKLKVCEIGVFEGNYSESIVETLTDSEIFLIDLWERQNNDFFYTKPEFTDSFFDKTYNNVIEKFSSNKNVNIIKKDSRYAHEDFEDGYFDWIYIDADHSYEGALRDIKNWLPKVKKGGFLSGHDFDPDGSWEMSVHFGVNQAVLENFDSEEIYVTNEIFYKSWLYRVK